MAAALKASRASRAVTRRVSRARTCTVAASTRPLWLPGSTPPAHLDGTLPCDYGFDPCGLGKDAKSLNWFVAAEVFHCRLAMTGVAGIVIPGLLTQAGVLNVPDWFEAGKIAQDSSPISFEALVGIEVLAVGFVEGKRWESINAGDSPYPGGAFDPLGLSKDEAALAVYKRKEIANGRLAMLAFLGFYAQHYATGKSPFENLAAHLADPAHANFAENGVSLPF